MSHAPDAQELHALRVTAIQKFSEAVGSPLGSVLDAINAICDYGSARQAWHDANSLPEDPPIWSEEWKEMFR